MSSEQGSGAGAQQYSIQRQYEYIKGIIIDIHSGEGSKLFASPQEGIVKLVSTVISAVEINDGPNAALSLLDGLRAAVIEDNKARGANEVN